MGMEWPDEYQKFINRMNTPRVVIDNSVCSTATLVKVDSARNHGILLDAVQFLTDLDLSITKAYISSDGRWFMDVFHVTDLHGNKLTDKALIASIEQSLSTPDNVLLEAPVLDVLEIKSTDRPGLLSEVFTILSDHNFTVAQAKVWTHHGRIASLIFLGENELNVVQIVEARLRSLLKRDSDVRGATINISSITLATADRRLHQMMFADRDYERSACSSSEVMVQNWVRRGYIVVNVLCRDRPRLLFDVICTLTDMNYVVLHATIDTYRDRARQEFYVRHLDGSPMRSEAERERVVQCLKAAIERRESKGLRVEVCSVDRRGLLAEVTRTFRENGVWIRGAEISTKGRTAMNVFHVTDAAGNAADPKTMDAVIQLLGVDFIKISTTRPPDRNTTGAALFHLGRNVKKNLYNLGLIRSSS